MSLQASSQFRRGVQRDDRRRRLLTEDIYSGGAMSQSSLSSDTAVTNQSGHYGDASFLDEQKRLIDLVPRRLITFALWLAVGMATIAGLEILHGWQYKLSATMPGGQFDAFDLTRTGCLGSWFSSLLLLAAATTAVLVYSIRRHRTDDYHGKYRIWLWAALCCFLAATDVATNLHESFKQIMIHLTKTRIWGDGTVWWIIPLVLAFSAVGSRLLMDMRRCWFSNMTFLLAAGYYLIVGSMELGLVTVGDAARAVMIKAGAALFGHLMLLLSMALYARHVILDAQGLLPPGESKPCRGSDEETAEDSSSVAGGGWMRVDSPVGTPQPVLRRTVTSTATSSVSTPSAFSSSSSSSAPVTRKLTKQEKKALRERLLRERMERERRFGS